MVKAKGSWVTEGTPSQQIIEYSPPFPPPLPSHPDLDLPAGKIYMH